MSVCVPQVERSAAVAGKMVKGILDDGFAHLKSASELFVREIRDAGAQAAAATATATAATQASSVASAAAAAAAGTDAGLDHEQSTGPTVPENVQCAAAMHPARISDPSDIQYLQQQQQQQRRQHDEAPLARTESEIRFSDTFEAEPDTYISPWAASFHAAAAAVQPQQHSSHISEDASDRRSRNSSDSGSVEEEDINDGNVSQVRDMCMRRSNTVAHSSPVSASMCAVPLCCSYSLSDIL